MDQVGSVMRAAFNYDSSKETRDYAVDFYWYLWCGPDSPLFDKSKMATFERYFLSDKETFPRGKGCYYELRNKEEICDMILDEFNVQGPHRHIINGHVPVRLNKGETPIRSQWQTDGDRWRICQGLSRHHRYCGLYPSCIPFERISARQTRAIYFAEEAIRNGSDIVSTTEIVELSQRRMRVRDTDKGRILQAQINELSELLYAYRHGIIKERWLQAAKKF